MYQLPVGNIEKIRKSRKKVKNILCEFGLEDCQYYLKDLNEKSRDSVVDDEAFKHTAWFDLSEGFDKMKKKWPYRSQLLCCSLCRYSARNIYSFRSHVARNHDDEKSHCALAPCSDCHFIGHPKALRKHIQFFHSSNTPATREPPLPVHHGKERYQCRKCGYPSSSIFAIKKHIILKHLEHLAQEFIGYRVQAYGKTYCCKLCKVNVGSLDHMFHHMLVEPSHHWVNTQVQILVGENKEYYIKQAPNGNGIFLTFPNIAPKPHTVNRPLVIPNNGQQTGTTMMAVQQLQGSPNNTTLICTTGTNQAFLSPQASALVQLATAETRDLLPPGATITLQGAVAQGSSMLQIPTTSVALKPAPLALVPAPVQPQHNQRAQQILFPSVVQAANMTGMVGAPGQPSMVAQKASTDQITPQGTMMTSQSLLSHLIPTGKRVSGLPTYTFAPIPVAVPTTQSTVTPLRPVEATSNCSLPTKKWITCPHCNELFPSNVYEMHMEVVHKTTSVTSKAESLAARAPFLKKMPDKTVKCLMCKILVSEKGVAQHLLHGLNCLYCSALFFSLTQLIEHVKEHNPSTKTYCDFLRREYRVYTEGSGQILFPYFDINTTAPKEILGNTEIHLVLVTNSLDLIFLKMLPCSDSDTCQSAMKSSNACCPLCDENFQNPVKHIQHLKQKHFVAPTIHAILKTEAFKCVYCNGVYTGKLTQQAVMLHLQRCRFSPKKHPDPPKPQESNAVMSRGIANLQQTPKPAGQMIQSPKLYFQIPQPLHLKQIQTLKPATLFSMVPAVGPVEKSAELQSKKRLEEAWKEVVESNKREREKKEEARLAVRRKRLQEKLVSTTQPEPQSNPTVKLVLEPTLIERNSNDERRAFICRYFNTNPYVTKGETDELCRRLTLTKSELAAYFGNRRVKCMKSLKRNTAVVLLGFNMAELSKVKHNLFIPNIRPVEPSEHAERHKASTAVVESRNTVESMELKLTERMKDSEKTERSKLAKDSNLD